MGEPKISGILSGGPVASRELYKIHQNELKFISKKLSNRYGKQLRNQLLNQAIS